MRSSTQVIRLNFAALTSPYKILRGDEGFSLLISTENIVEDCSEHLRAGRYKSGIYRISPEDASEAAAFDIFCDMVTLGGGWTVLQRFVF